MNARGYTLVELLIAISISTVLLLSVGYFTVEGIMTDYQDYNKTSVLSNAEQAVAVVSRQVRQARSVEAANTLPDNNAPGAPGNLYSWSGSAGNDATLILAVPSRTSTGSIIYVDSAHTQEYTDEYIYYLESSTHRLYRRYIANSSAPGNGGISTCPPAKASGSCPADPVIVDDVADLATSYYDSNGNSIQTPTGTEAVGFTVTETRTIFGRILTGTYTTVTALRNR